MCPAAFLPQGSEMQPLLSAMFLSLQDQLVEFFKVYQSHLLCSDLPSLRADPQFEMKVGRGGRATPSTSTAKIKVSQCHVH